MSFTLLSLGTLGGGSVSSIYGLPWYHNVTPEAPWVGEVASSRMITVSQTYLCRKCTIVAILVTARPLYSLTGHYCGPTALGKNIGYMSEALHMGGVGDKDGNESAFSAQICLGNRDHPGGGNLPHQ